MFGQLINSINRKLHNKKNGELEIIPTTTSSKHDFDFYVGNWRIRNRKLNKRLSNSNEWTEFDALLYFEK